MGVHGSRFKERSLNSSLADLSHTDNRWIIAHSDATELYLPEVERLWLRFKSLGADDNGTLKVGDIKDENYANVYEKQLFQALQDNDEAISFQTFLYEMKFAQMDSAEKKLSAIFNLLNDGNPLKKEDLERMLKQLYPDDTEEDTANNALGILRDAGIAETDSMSRQQFIRWVISVGLDLDSLLSFTIIPKELTDQQARNESPYPDEAVGGRRIPDDELLRQVARSLERRDWYLLANKLHFTARNIEEFEQKYPRNPVEQVYEMLITWRRKEGYSAATVVLEKALRESNLNDIALKLT